MTTLSNAPPGPARRVLRSPPARVLVLGFILVLMMISVPNTARAASSAATVPMSSSDISRE